MSTTMAQRRPRSRAWVAWIGVVTSAVVARGQMPATRPTTGPGEWRLADMPLHDPFILAHEPTRTYYLYTSNHPPLTGVRRAGTMVYRSRDLLHWDPPTVVFTVPDGTWADPKRSAWAPEVHAYNGKFYLFTTLHNPAKVIATQPAVWHENSMRGTAIAVADSPDGPFALLKRDGPVPPADFMTLDGTLYVDPAGRPWMVYAHEWVQVVDGTMEAVPLSPDLAAAAGPPVHLFRASSAPWLDANRVPSRAEATYTTDGPELFRTKDNHLLMLWASYDRGQYVQTVARSTTGDLRGPWEQLPPLLGDDTGHGMLFRTFDGQLMMVVHRPFKRARGKLYDVADDGDRLRIVRHRTDLDGDPR